METLTRKTLALAALEGLEARRRRVDEQIRLLRMAAKQTQPSRRLERAGARRRKQVARPR